jgi:NAD(P)H-dependent FMN reductase
MSTRIIALVGSLRVGSHNRQLAEAAVHHAPPGIEIAVYEGLVALPYYNEDIDDGTEPAAEALRAAVHAADALILFSPEYNGTMPALLKNAIDWLSRPFGSGALAEKPLAVVGAAYGSYGGVWAHDDVRKSAGVAGALVVKDVQLSVPASRTRFAETHPIEDAEVVAKLAEVLDALVEAVASRHLPEPRHARADDPIFQR